MPDADVPRPSGGQPFDGLKEACGVFGVYGPGQPVAQLTYLGLFALQHRGQEAAGMAVSDGETLTVVKDQGLVASVFDDRTLGGLAGHLAIGHCRYSTTGASSWHNAQPVYRSVGEHEFALGHNGNLVNTEHLAKEAGMFDGMAGDDLVTSDSDLVAALIAAELRGTSLPGAVAAVVPRLEGAFSLVVMGEDCVIGVRDPHGFRPLCLGRLGEGPDASWVIASESPALDIVGATFVRELEAGEMVVVDGDGPRSLRPFDDEEVDPRLCLFEFVYFARPDSRLYGRSVHQARIRMGEQLAEQAPVAADMVMGVPESGVPAAEGFAHRSGIPLGQGLVKNRYVGRSFIAPTQELRVRAVRMKLNPLRENIEGKRLVVIDDSIVRGTTQRTLVGMLREAGATEVHLRISSPPVLWPCFYGIDTGERSQLLAHKLDLDGIRDDLGADTLAYLDLGRLVTATGAEGAGFCDACFTGHYAVEVPVALRKHVLENNEQRFAEDRLTDDPVQPVLVEGTGR